MVMKNSQSSIQRLPKLVVLVWKYTIWQPCFPKPGVDVMITIFCDFRQFSPKKLAFFSKTNVMIKILHSLALFWVKNVNFFAEFFGENI
jgi:hypothetical protein